LASSVILILGLFKLSFQALHLPSGFDLPPKRAAIRFLV
jgi:hypothetical protein